MNNKNKNKSYAIEISNLEHSFGGRKVLDIPSFYFEKGKAYGIIGPNGSGKSTLLRLLTKVISIQKGNIINNLNSFIYMPQKPYVFDYSVIRNVLLATKNSGDSLDLALEAIEKMNLSNLKYKAARSLSGGEAQRMALARIILSSEPLILLDEPTSSMDIKSTYLVQSILNEIVRSTKRTLIFTTHSPAQVANLADEVIILNDGYISEYGSTNQVLFNPKTIEAKQFLSYWRLEGICLK